VTTINPGNTLSDLFLRANVCFSHHPIMVDLAEKFEMACPRTRQYTPDGKALTSRLQNSVEYFCSDIHNRNVQAGWWTDLSTGTFKQRNIGELLMLICTELEEARQGQNTNCADDKLPHRSMLEVEIADALIRLGDLCGYYVPDFAEAFTAECWSDPDPLTTSGIVFSGGVFLAQAMEASRKNRTMAPALAKFAVWALRFSLQHNLQICSAVVEKLDYNAQRADHKIENRRKPDGKKT